MKILAPILLFLIVIASGCYSIETVESTKISSADIYQSYYITADKDHTSVTATFRFGSKSGTTIDLDAPSKIELNGKIMPEMAASGWKGTTYEYSTGKFSGQMQFAFTDGDGKIFRNEINFAPLEFSANSIKVSRTNRTVVPLSRTVGENETVIASMSGKIKTAKNSANEDSSETVLVNLDSAHSAIVIEPEDLKNFADGKVFLSLKITKTEPLKQAGRNGGEIQFLYEAQGISLPIVK